MSNIEGQKTAFIYQLRSGQVLMQNPEYQRFWIPAGVYPAFVCGARMTSERVERDISL